ncbi:MAG: putative zinc-binding metallopeptidase [Pirellulales bacterium]
MERTDLAFETGLGSTPIRDLGLKIAGTPLEPIVRQFESELDRAGIRRLRPRFYLSTEWGVPTGSVAIAMPFYLARPDLTALHAQRTGYVEGLDPADILRYLRHEMGHVVNYAYRLYDEPEWVKLFGAITQPYVEEYRPQPFSRRFVRHLPGWYAQKHPDEDWAETFAVWMTPGIDWRAQYAGAPEAMAKLAYCDRTMAALSDRDPLVAQGNLDEDVGELGYSVEQFYASLPHDQDVFPPGLDGALRTIFEDLGFHEDLSTAAPRRPASALLKRLEPDLLANVFRWTGHFPERTQLLLKHLQRRADELKQVYPEDREQPLAIAFTALITALAMNYVHHGNYLR